MPLRLAARVLLFLALACSIATVRISAQTHPAAPAQALPLAGSYAGTLAGRRGTAPPPAAPDEEREWLASCHARQPRSGRLRYRSHRRLAIRREFKIGVASVGAHFEGKISADRVTIDGIWKQGNAELPLVFRRHAASASFKAKDAVFPIEGLWQSALETHGMRLRLQLHVSHDTEKHLVAALDSLDQGVSGLPANRVSLNESAFHFEIPAVDGVYEGKFDAAKNTINGNWSQTGAEQVLEFKRSDEPLALRRPQNPIEPYPYREETVSFSNLTAKIDLAGTLTLPKRLRPISGRDSHRWLRPSRSRRRTRRPSALSHYCRHVDS